MKVWFHVKIYFVNLFKKVTSSSPFRRIWPLGTKEKDRFNWPKHVSNMEQRRSTQQLPLPLH